MALPITIVSDVGLGGHHPPYKSSGVNYYSVVRADADELDVYKATDPTDAWTLQGTGPVHAGTILGYSTVQDGDVIHMIAWSSATYEYYTFNMATDAWVVDQLIETPAQAPTWPWGSIAVRSDGDVVVVYAGDTDQNMGDKKERADVNVRTAGTWGGPVALDAGGDIHYGNPNVVKGATSDRMHIVFQTQPSVTFDPPQSWTDSFGRTLSTSDVLSTVSTYSSDSGNTLNGFPLLLCWEDVTTGTVYIGDIYASQGADYQRRAARWEEDISGDIDMTTGTQTVQQTPPHFVNVEEGIIASAITPPPENKVHTLLSGGGVLGVDQDLYYEARQVNLTQAIPTNVEITDGITVNFISSNIYNRGYDTVLAFVYDDGGVQKYSELLIQQRQYYFPNTQNTLLRM